MSRRRNVRRDRAVIGYGKDGGKYIPSVQPPVLTTQPWNSLVVMYQATVTASQAAFIDSSSLKNKMLNQLGFSKIVTKQATTYVDFDLRIRSISVWALGQDVHIMMQPINILTNYSKIENKNGLVELARIESHSQKNMYARVGYTFPSFISESPFSTVENYNIAALSASRQTDVEVHVSVLWKGADTALAVRTTRYEYIPLCTRLRSLADDLEECHIDNTSTPDDASLIHELERANENPG